MLKYFRITTKTKKGEKNLNQKTKKRGNKQKRQKTRTDRKHKIS